MSASGPSADRNLLFGILALQMDFVSKDGLIGAMNAWVLDKAKPLGDILAEQGTLRPEHRTLLDALVQAHLALHGDDAAKSLAALSSLGSARQELEQIADPDVRASLGIVASAHDDADDPYATRAPATVGESTSAGLRFRILRPHAEGGLGKVSVAFDEELNREVALKEIKLDCADDDHSRARFLLEAEVTGGLEHPGVVPVYGLGTYADGRPFYAMRFIRGNSLEEALERFHKKGRALTRVDFESSEFRGLLGRFVDVCNAMAYAHSRQVLHRDLKPANVMLGKYGETLVVDWGLAKPLARKGAAAAAAPAADEPPLEPLAAHDLGQTRRGSVAGTPAYMSPEQARGRWEMVGPASDICSLGATLYAVLTGQPPFMGADIVEVIDKAQQSDYPPPRQVNPAVPPALEAVCRKAMAPDREDRYPSALELAADVERWLADEPVTAYREPFSVRAWRWARRHRVSVTGGIVLLSTAAVGLLIGNVVLGRANERVRAEATRADNERNQAVTAQEQEKTQRIAADLARERARATVYAARSTLAQREWQNANLGLVDNLLQLQRPDVTDPVDRRGWEWWYTLRLGQADLRGFSKEGTGWVGFIRIDPAASRVATAHHRMSSDDFLNDGVLLSDLATGQLVRRIEPDRYPTAALEFSPDGRWLVMGGGDKSFKTRAGSLKVWDSATWQEVHDLKGHVGWVQALAFSPDGRWLVSGGNDGTVRYWETGTWRLERTVQVIPQPGPAGMVTAVAFSPDGLRLAACGTDHLVHLWNSATGAEISTLYGHTEGVNSIAWSPDGRRLVSAGHDRTVRVWDPTDGRELRVLRGHADEVNEVAFHPDGRRVVSAGGDATLRVWDPETGDEIRTLRGHRDAVRGLAVERTGWRIVSVGDTVRIWDAGADADVLASRAVNPGVSGALSLSPDGQRLAFANRMGYTVWDPTTGQETHRPGGHRLPLCDLTFSPDGSRLVTSGWDMAVKFWDLPSGKLLQTFSGHTMPALGVAISPDGRRIASASLDRTVRLWDTANGQEVRSFTGGAQGFSAVAFNPRDGRLVAGGADGKIQVWDPETGILLRTLDGPGAVVCLRFALGGRRLIAAGVEGEVGLWDWESGERLQFFKGTENSWGIKVALDPLGQRLFAVGRHSLRIWDALNGLEVFTIKFEDQVHDLALFPDGRRLAVLTDKEVRLYDAREMGSDIQAEREAFSLLKFLVSRPLLKKEVDAALADAGPVSDAVRDRARQLLVHVSDEPMRFNNAAWEAARQPGLDPGRYRSALRLAQTACDMAPDNGMCLNTLGVLQFRVGDDAEAVKTLTRSEKLNAQRLGLFTVVPDPSDTAFLAMAHYRLGRAEEARKYLEQTRKAVKLPPWNANPEAVRFLREADALIQPPPKS